MSEHTPTAYESLIQFLYQVPIGLVQTTLDGEITMINPMAAQLLMPLAPAGDLTNLFDVLQDLAPPLRAPARAAMRALPPGSVVCEGLRLNLPPSAGPGQTLSLRLLSQRG